ncbi:MAG: hypothetical protein ACP5HM_05875 [Anaerolineae bacterium]
MSLINRAREIVKLMGYDDLDAALDAIGHGDLILLKITKRQELRVAEWLRAQAAELEEEETELSRALVDLADGLEFTLELRRYPATADICELDLPHGWPSYCDKRRIQEERT